MDKSQTLDLLSTRLVWKSITSNWLDVSRPCQNPHSWICTNWSGGNFSMWDVLAVLYYLIVPSRYGFQVKLQLSPHLRNGPRPAGEAEYHTDEMLPSALSSPARVPNQSEISYTWDKVSLWEPVCFSFNINEYASFTVIGVKKKSHILLPSSIGLLNFCWSLLNSSGIWFNFDRKATKRQETWIFIQTELASLFPSASRFPLLPPPPPPALRFPFISPFLCFLILPSPYNFLIFLRHCLKTALSCVSVF